MTLNKKKLIIIFGDLSGKQAMQSNKDTGLKSLPASHLQQWLYTLRWDSIAFS